MTSADFAPGHGMHNTDYKDGWFKSADGLDLYYRDYVGPDESAELPVLCLHGLTRNSADFEPVADLLAKQRRVIAVDLRGRGRSQFDPVLANYNAYQYVADVFAILDAIGIERMVCVGTSLGGWITTLLATQRPQSVAAAIINDIGAELEQAGLDRIIASFRSRKAVTSWDEAIEQTRAIFGHGVNNLPAGTWRWYAQKTFRENSDGSLDPQFDSNIGVAVLTGLSGLQHDGWQLFDALKSTPTLVLRGANSDILSCNVLDRMLKRYPLMQAVQVADRGHVPLLNEPEVINAIPDFLKSVGSDRA